LENSIEDLGGNSDNSMKPFPQIEKEWILLNECFETSIALISKIELKNYKKTFDQHFLGNKDKNYKQKL
jgi:hypothetical protein